MAKANRPDPGIDYYEYKRQHDMVRMRQRAVEIAGEVEQPEDRAEPEPEQQRGARLGKFLGGIKRPSREAVEDVEAEAVQADAPERAAHDREQADSNAQSEAEKSETEAKSAPGGAPEPEALEELDDIPEDDAPEIHNPFAGALDRLKLVGGKLASLGQRLSKPEPRESGDPDRQDEPPAEDEKTAVFSLTKALSERNEDIAPRRRRRAPAVHMVENDEDPFDQGAEDPLGVMRPADEDTHRAFMRPNGAPNHQDEEDASVLAAQAVSTPAREEFPMSDNELNRPELTEKLMDELDGVPALSRRERKAMANAGTLAKPAAKPAETEPGDQGDDQPTSVDEPTQQFKPLRARPVKRAPAPLDDEEYGEDGEDEDYDDIEPERPRFGGRFGGKKRRVYRDEELDDGDDDDYDEDDYDEVDYDEDDEEDYDDYDEDEAYDSAYHVSFGRRVLGFLKGLLILALVFLIVVVALRQLESSGILSLDGVRGTIGQILPIEVLLPPPDRAAESVPPETPDELESTPEPEETPAPTPTSAPTPTPEPLAAPVIDPGAEGSPLAPDELDETEAGSATVDMGGPAMV